MRRFLRNLDWSLVFIWLLVSLIVGFFAILFAAISQNSKWQKDHPCIEWGAKQTCYMPGTWITTDATTGQGYMTPGYDYNCTPCLKRKGDSHL